jgi:hypothetical protein
MSDERRDISNKRKINGKPGHDFAFRGEVLAGMGGSGQEQRRAMSDV